MLGIPNDSPQPQAKYVITRPSEGITRFFSVRILRQVVPGGDRQFVATQFG